MFRIVCTKHLKNLRLHDSGYDSFSRMAIISMTCPFHDVVFDKNQKHWHDYGFDLTNMSCPDNQMNEAVNARRLPGETFDEWMDRTDDLDCSAWHAVVFSASNEPVDSYWATRVHPAWWQETRNSR